MLIPSKPKITSLFFFFLLFTFFFFSFLFLKLYNYYFRGFNVHIFVFIVVDYMAYDDKQYLQLFVHHEDITVS